MKKILFIVFLCFLSVAKAQYVTIPDPGFASFLQGVVPAAMNGNQLDTTNSDILTITDLTVGPVNQYTVSNLYGIQFFKDLLSLSCSGNHITTIPCLPASLISLDCSDNQIQLLPQLPNSMQYLVCYTNPITTLFSLPDSLKLLDCGSNSLANIPSFPSRLENFHCLGSNLSSLPPLPQTLNTLICQGSNLTTLPTLPNNLQWVNLANNQISSLPTLPLSLLSLTVRSNQLTSLPILPPHLGTLDCEWNQLTSLPPLPSNITNLNCGGNNIACFDPFSSSITTIAIQNNPFDCLPNYINAMNQTTLSYPLCMTGNSNGCPTSTSCAPVTYFVGNYDSLNPHNLTLLAYYSQNTDSAFWSWGDGTFSNGFFPTHTYVNGGMYNICLTAYAFCGDSVVFCLSDSIYRMSDQNSNVPVTITVIDYNTYGINQPTKNLEVRLYPNPNAGISALETTSEPDEIKILGPLGTLIKQIEPLGNKNIVELSSGVYFVEVVVAGQRQVRRLIVYN